MSPSPGRNRASGVSTICSGDGVNYDASIVTNESPIKISVCGSLVADLDPVFVNFTLEIRFKKWIDCDCPMCKFDRSFGASFRDWFLSPDFSHVVIQVGGEEIPARFSSPLLQTSLRFRDERIRLRSHRDRRFRRRFFQASPRVHLPRSASNGQLSILACFPSFSCRK